MLPDLRHQVGVVVILLILLTGLPLRSVKAGDDHPYDRTPFAGFPETVAVEEMLRQEQAFDILRSTSQVASDTSGDFGTATVVYSQAGREEQLKVFLLKEGEAWQAYQDIPVHKDHPGVFFLLARGYCAQKFGETLGMSYADDSWQGKDPGRRTINFICSQQVKSEWQDHPVSLVFTYSKGQGWQMTEESSGGKCPAEAGAGDKGSPAAHGQDKGQPSPLHLAAALSPLSPDNEAYALQLVREGADVNLPDEFGNTPLHILCYSCLSPRLVQALLAAGADVHLKTREGQTALDLINMMAKSGQSGNCDTIRAQLLKAGAR